jgi:hypothetical protein
MTSTEPYTAAATQARQATENSIDAWRHGATTFTDQFDQVTFPTVDLTEPVTRYFDYVQRAVDFNRDLAIRWAELVTSLSGSVRDQAARVTSIVNDQTNTIADPTVKQADKPEQVARKQADKPEQVARKQADTVENAKKDQAQQARAAEHQQAKKDREQAREPYLGLTKAELAVQLAERGLPKTGTVEELIERLVGADDE